MRSCAFMNCTCSAAGWQTIISSCARNMAGCSRAAYSNHLPFSFSWEDLGAYFVAFELMMSSSLHLQPALTEDGTFRLPGASQGTPCCHGSEMSALPSKSRSS